MHRRAFIILFGSAVSSLYSANCSAQSQPSRVYKLGLLAQARDPTTEALQDSLRKLGYLEGQNLKIEYRSLEGGATTLDALAVELVRLGPDVIVAWGTPATQAAKNATRTVPIVAINNDPVASGFVVSLARPGRNITGVSLQSGELAGRRIQLLTELVPGLARVAILSNPANQSHAGLVKQSQAAARSLGIEIEVANAPAPDRLENAFAAITTARAGALIVLPDVMFFAQYPRVVAFTAASHLPALFPEKQPVEAGGFIAYGTSIPGSFRRAGAYVDKIFRGANPADLPVEQPTTFEFVINLKTAKALGLTVPDKLLSTADEVIE
jgi:putative tryptophan/tyrosine transport system substrate-binding protein